jgi:hypothetical protein
MDEDGDGRISKDEFRGPKNRFGMIDADGDGYVTKEEFAVALGRRQTQGLKVSEHPNAAWYAKLPVILTHTHVAARISRGSSDWDGAAARAVERMDETGVRASVIMPVGAGGKDASYLGKLFEMAKNIPPGSRSAAAARDL